MNILNKTLIINLSLILIASCGGTGAPTQLSTNSPNASSVIFGTDYHELTGSWIGTYEDSNSVLYLASFTISAEGTVTSLLLNGSNIGVTATLTNLDTSIYKISFDDGTSGIFLVDGSNKYAAFIHDINFGFALLQKDAQTPNQAYSQDDVNGSWMGTSIILDNEFNLIKSIDSSMSIYNDGSITTDIGGANYIGSLGQFKTEFGAYYVDGKLDDDLYSAVVLLSPDKTFAASWNCIEDADCPIGCTFSIWR